MVHPVSRISERCTQISGERYVWSLSNGRKTADFAFQKESIPTSPSASPGAKLFRTDINFLTISAARSLTSSGAFRPLLLPAAIGLWKVAWLSKLLAPSWPMVPVVMPVTHRAYEYVTGMSVPDGVEGGVTVYATSKANIGMSLKMAVSAGVPSLPAQAIPRRIGVIGFSFGLCFRTISCGSISALTESNGRSSKLSPTSPATTEILLAKWRAFVRGYLPVAPARLSSTLFGSRVSRECFLTPAGSVDFCSSISNCHF